jgi:hypothetical protein
MTESYASAIECRSLYALMDQVKQIAPWEWMTETDMFGVQRAGASEPDFVNVMGMAGEHYAVSLYLGISGMFQFWHFEQNQARMSAEDLLQIPQLQASFEDREILNKRDRDLLKETGLKYRGRKAWPQLRSYRPGLLPWHLAADEVERLQVALEQLLVVAPRFHEDPKVIHVSGQNRFFVRVAEQQGDSIVWRDEVQKITQAPAVTIQFAMDLGLLAAVKKLPRVQNNLEIDLFLMPTPIYDRGERPYFPFNLLVGESKSGVILGTELLQPLPSVEAMWAKVPLHLVRLLSQIGVIPAAIHVSSPLLMQLLPVLSQELGVHLKERKQLPMLDSAKREMMQMMSRFA